MKIPDEILDYKGQGENPDFSFLVAEFDKSIDLLLGINHQEAEAQIQQSDEELYKNLEPEALLTSYLDYHQIFDDLGPEKRIIDLGAGYCRGTVLSSLDDSYKIKCLSIEKVKERLAQARSALNREGISAPLLFEEDILDPSFKLPKADAIYLYLPSGRLINKILSLIIINGLNNLIIYAIESHGDLFDNLSFYTQILIPLKCNLKTSLKRHHPRIKKFVTPQDLSDLQKQFKKLKKEEITNLEVLPLWLLKFGHTSQRVRIKSKIAGVNKFREWDADLKDSNLLLYNNQLALALSTSNRILQLGSQDQITKLLV